MWRAVSTFFCLITSLQAFSLPLDIFITGLDKANLEAVQNNLTLSGMPSDKINVQSEIFNLYQLTSQEILTTLNALGYYQATITDALHNTPKGWIAEYNISLGKPVIIRDIKIQITGEGATQNALQHLKSNYLKKINEQFKHATYEDIKTNLLNHAQEIGFLEAQYTKYEVLVDREKLSAIIILDLDTKHRYKFGNITFINPVYQQKFLTRYVPFHYGEPYTIKKILEFQKILLDTDFFTKVRVVPNPKEGKNAFVPIEVRLENKPKNKYSAGGGYGTDTGVRINASWERKRLDYPGHRISMDSKLTLHEKRANFKYIIPGRNPLSDTTTVGTRLTRWDEYVDKKPILMSMRTDFIINHLTKKANWESSGSLNYLTELYRIGDDPKQHANFFLPGFSYTCVHADKDQNYVQKGISIGLGITGGLKTFFSSTNLSQTEFKIKGVYPISVPLGIRFLFRSDVGATYAKNFNIVPVSLRFYTGGDNTVRGYKYNELGPQRLDDQGQLVNTGGRYKVVHSIEIDKSITPPLKVAVFLDAGNAMNRWKERLRYGAGAGIRWATPVGPLRIDIAQPLERQQKEFRLKNWRIHLTFGWDL